MPGRYWTMVTCNVVVPQLLWFQKIRRSPVLMFPIVILVNVGMWFERFVIVVTSLHRDYLPSSWDMFSPDLGRRGAVRGQYRALPDPGAALLPLPADGRGRGDEGDPARQAAASGGHHG